MSHTCHWPGCLREVPPAMWGCKPHWFALPANLRAGIWRTYRPGQEITKTPSDAYIEAAQAVRNWIDSQARPAAPFRNTQPGSQMTLVYHANRAYLYCDPAEDRMALVSKEDFDDVVSDRAGAEGSLVDCARINIGLIKQNRELEAVLRECQKISTSYLGTKLQAQIDSALGSAQQRPGVT